MLNELPHSFFLWVHILLTLAAIAHSSRQASCSHRLVTP